MGLTSFHLSTEINCGSFPTQSFDLYFLVQCVPSRFKATLSAEDARPGCEITPVLGLQVPLEGPTAYWSAVLKEEYNIINHFH